MTYKPQQTSPTHFTQSRVPRPLPAWGRGRLAVRGALRSESDRRCGTGLACETYYAERNSLSLHACLVIALLYICTHMYIHAVLLPLLATAVCMGPFCHSDCLSSHFHNDQAIKVWSLLGKGTGKYEKLLQKEITGLRSASCDKLNTIVNSVLCVMLFMEHYSSSNCNNTCLQSKFVNLLSAKLKGTARHNCRK